MMKEATFVIYYNTEYYKTPATSLFPAENQQVYLCNFPVFR